jgi:DNA-binding SARP family transcriptional activator
LAFLLLHQYLIPREVLMDVFWMDHSPDRARSSLTTALWRLRHLLEPEHVQPGTYLITRSTGEVGFNWDSNYSLDSKSFESHIYPVLRRPLADLRAEDVRQIEEVLTLYRGDLLEGMYEDWALRERERFRSLHLNCLTRLMEWHAHSGNRDQSIAIGHEILHRDPVREEIHRALMRYYLESGQRSLATRQYMQCRDLLAQELGVAPLEETQVLYQQIMASPHAGIQPTGDLPHRYELTRLVHELQFVRQTLLEAGRTLERIQRSISDLTSAD